MTQARLLVYGLVLAVSPLRAEPLVVTPDAQRLAGIRVEAVKRQPVAFDFEVPAQIIDPLPLIEASHRFKTKTLELAAQEQIAAILQQRLARLEKIGHDLRRDPLEQTRQDLLAAKARAEALTLELAQLKSELAAEWGATLLAWVQTGSDNLSRLARGDAYLVRLTFPRDDLPKTAVLEHQGALLPLEYLSPAPKTDPWFAGTPHYYYLASSSPGLALGLRLTAKVQDRMEAILVPSQAVVWEQGQAWVFVKTAHSRFERRALQAWREAEENLWVTRGLEPGEQVVAQGAQLLLAEERKAQVPDEDTDD
ncbi:hypothetical protein JCM13664_03500 [Methylothermus subterraneus]